MLSLNHHLETALNVMAAMTIVVHTVSVLLMEVHIALPECVQAYYPTQAILGPIKSYISSTGDCLTASPPVWVRVSSALAALMTPALLCMLPAVFKGGKPVLRCPLMLLAACSAVTDVQLWLHYIGTENMCGAKQLVDLRPALAFHGARGLCWLALAARLLLDEGYGKRRRANDPSDSRPVTTRSRAAKKKAK